MALTYILNFESYESYKIISTFDFKEDCYFILSNDEITTKTKYSDYMSVIGDTQVNKVK